MRYFYGIGLCAMFLLAGCGGGGGGNAISGSGAGSNVMTGTIKGFVYATPTTGNGAVAGFQVSARPLTQGQQPVAGATVTIRNTPRSTTTTAAGEFTLLDVPVGDQQLEITHSLYRDPLILAVTVKANAVTTVEPALGVGYFIFVGAGKYANLPPQNQLQGPPGDARGMANILFPSFAGTGTLLIDGDATKQRIKDAIASATSKMGANDFLIFFFSGHGTSFSTDGGKIDAICPSDLQLDTLSTYITDTELRDWLGQMPNPQRSVVILDSCYAGSFFDGSISVRGARARVAPLRTMRALQQTGCTVLSSSLDVELSWELNGEGVFTRYLVQGLDTGKTAADVNKDRRITAQELFDYAAPRATNEISLQHPAIQVGTNPVLLRF